MLHFQAVLPYERGLWAPVLDELVIASEPVLNWRQQRDFRHVIQLLLAIDVTPVSHPAITRVLG